MLPIRRLLCPIDFSDTSRRAFDYAVAIAHRHESTLTVLHVFTAPPVVMYAPAAHALAATIMTPEGRDQLLAGMRAFTQTNEGVRTEFAITEGPVAGEILANATAHPPDMIVIGTHGRSGFRHLMLGSVAERVLHDARCPVLTVPPRQANAAPPRPALFTRILCPFDFSDCSMRALRFAMSLADGPNAHLTVVYVVETPEQTPAVESAIGVERHYYERLEQVVPESLKASCTVETAVRTGKPGREIMRMAVELRSDLIVMGIHGRGPVERLFLGSTAEHVIRQASCPVLTVRDR